MSGTTSSHGQVHEPHRHKQSAKHLCTTSPKKIQAASPQPSAVLHETSRPAPPVGRELRPGDTRGGGRTGRPGRPKTHTDYERFFLPPTLFWLWLRDRGLLPPPRFVAVAPRLAPRAPLPAGVLLRLPARFSGEAPPPPAARFFGEAPPPPAAAAVFGLVYLMISGSVAQKIGKGGPEDIFLSIQALEGAV